MNLEHLLTEENRQTREMIRDFTKKEIIPKVKQLESDYSLVEEIHQKLVDMGIQASGYPTEYGGGGDVSFTSIALICEELAKGDGGISLTAGLNSGLVLAPAAMANNKVIMDRFFPLFCGGKLAYACNAMGDEAGGADSENTLLKGAGIKTIAKLEGDEYVINGIKAWPTHAGIAECYLTICTTDPNLGDDGITIIVVPKDTPGLTFSKPENKMLYKTAINGTIYYDNVRVPKEYRIAGPGTDADLYYGMIGGSGVHMCIQGLGIAERAFEIVLDYTGHRMGGFKPVRQHSIAAGIIADMAIGIEMMRAALYNMAYMLDHQDLYGSMSSPAFLSKAAATRVFCADTAVEIINRGAELLGCTAISEDFPYAKCLRDVKLMQLGMAGQQVNRYKVVKGYYDLKNWA